MKAISFFVDTIKIFPDTATKAENLNKAISVREFANGEPVSLYELETGELILQKGEYPNINFIQGYEV